MMLGVSLFGLGEYTYAAEYLRSSLDNWDDQLVYEWDIQSFYGDNPDFAEHRRVLEEIVAEPGGGNADNLLVLGFVRYHGGDARGAGEAFERLVDMDADADRMIATRYLHALAVRDGRKPATAIDQAKSSASESIGAFLQDPALMRVPDLPIR